MKMSDLRGKIAVVTGGASGIGRGIAEALIEQGAQVVIADIEERPLHKTADEIGATAFRVDVAQAESVEALAQEVQSRFGKVDIVCNNAGVGSMGKIADLKLSDWQWILNVNLFGVIHGVQSFLPLLKANPDGGQILNTASVAGLATIPMLGAYSVSKFGVVALTEALADELRAENSKVGAGLLLPGPVRSNLNKSQRNRPMVTGESALIDVDLDDLSGVIGDTVPWMDPIDAGRIAVEAIKDGRLYAITHPAFYGEIGARHAAIAAAFGA